ncbi:hypothetical protein [Nocardia cerradoensis]|uniref:Uncharacterized protein n=1 Tax=Nocardia cerradoensis TaxID=85688 RepID=A0A231HG77_9NOCA|nr:hypothetical protein [Nocardia cerradoensis]NKY45098.1 hypothetical protein [Nocardia cerradoensis]OXR47727.1 hypothetical protein B7C42_00852 [Nocardia cerradoensis]
MTRPPTFTVGEFRKASASSPHQNCVRVARKHGWTAVWDDKRATAATTAGTAVIGTEILLLRDEQFDSYQAGIRAGRTERLPITQFRRPDGRYVLRAETGRPTADVELIFDRAELDAFHHGVRTHEFDLHRFTAPALDDTECDTRATGLTARIPA